MPDARLTPAREEENVYADVYKVLLAGMVASSILFAVGVVLGLLHPKYIPLTADWTREHYHWKGLVSGLAVLDPAAIMLLATLLLILTPVVRVLVSIYAFYVDHDWKFVVVTGIVFLVIVLTVALARLGLQ